MDPVTMSLLALQGAAGVGKAVYGASQRARGKRALSEAYVAPTGRPKEYAEMLAQARQSDVRQRQLDEINKSMATSTEALQRAGSRGVIGGIGAVTEAGIKGRTGVLGQQQADIMAAMRANIQGAENQRTRDVAREGRERGEATAAIAAGTQNVVGGLTDIAKTAVTGLGAMDAGGEDKRAARRNAQKLTEEAQDELFKEVSTIPSGGKSFQTPTLSEFKKLAEGVGKLNVTETQLEEIPEEYDDGEEFDDGGVQKTPGDFSHKTNPIDIIKDGAKIGEMTGGEYIFNPSQAKKLKQLSSSGNSKLHKFVSSLLNKPQFK
jgi:hypothetical protein